MMEDYWTLRSKLAKILFPRTQYLFDRNLLQLAKDSDIREKGRKKGYAQYNVISSRFERKELLFKDKIIKNFLEVSAHASTCALPLNIDVWDNFRCPFGCLYCFSNKYKSSLYTSFYDNAREVGLRACSPDYFIPKMEKLLSASERSIQGASAITKAVSLKIPFKIGARFENLLPVEVHTGATLAMMQFLANNKYPFFVNTKSTVIAADAYLKVLSNFKKGVAVQLSMISGDEDFIKRAEPNAPSIKARMRACKKLSDEGIHVVARIEPFIVYLTDSKDKVDDYIGMLKENNVKTVIMNNLFYGITNNVRESFHTIGLDIDRAANASSISQRISSYLMSAFANYFRKHGLRVSTSDFGGMAENDHPYMCCGFDPNPPYNNINYGNLSYAIRFIQHAGGTPVAWSDFSTHVQSKGGFLSDAIREQVRNIWNLSLYNDKDSAYTLDFAAHFLPVGEDEDGLIWKYDKGFDFRKEPIQRFLEEAL